MLWFCFSYADTAFKWGLIHFYKNVNEPPPPPHKIALLCVGLQIYIQKIKAIQDKQQTHQKWSHSEAHVTAAPLFVNMGVCVCGRMYLGSVATVQGRLMTRAHHSCGALSMAVALWFIIL